jgi:hypothetical protein
MKIWRRATISAEAAEHWRQKGLKVFPFKTPGSEIIKRYQFEIEEGDPLWPELKTFLNKAHTYIRTRFTDTELLEADWCIIWGDHSIRSYGIPRGYAWSEDYFQDQCKKCGSGWKQIAPLRVQPEPKLGKSQFCGFGGGFELFCTPVVIDEFARQHINGFEIWPLLLGKRGGEQAKSLKQIVVTEMAQPAIVEELAEHERYSQTDCPICGRTWHAHYVRGMLPMRRSALKQNTDFQLTNEWFGNGLTARHEIVVSRQVVRMIFEKKWKGAYLIPIQAV